MYKKVLYIYPHPFHINSIEERAMKLIISMTTIINILNDA